MSKQAQLADGTILDFPDDTPDDVMDRAVKNHVIKEQQKTQFPTSVEMGGKPGAMVQPRMDMTDPNRTRGQVALDQMSRVGPGALKAVTGIPNTVAGVGEALSQMLTGGGTGKAQAALGGMAKGAVQPVIPVAQSIAMAIPGGSHVLGNAPPPESPEWAQAAEGAGTMLGGALLEPAARGIGALAKKIPLPNAPEFAAVALPRRIMSSLLKPDKRAFDFGADPIKEILDLGGFNPSANLTSLKAKVGTAMTAQEAKLAAALKARTAGSMREGMPNVENVAPALTAPLDEAVTLAKRDANPSLAKRLERFRDARIKYLTDKYGSTYLTPDQILAEKRLLRDEVKFTQDAVQQNLNTAKMGMYRGYDNVLDKMVPEAKAINQRYSGLIEADKLLDSRIIQANKAALLSKEGIAFTGPKTTLADIFKRKGLMDTPAAEAIFGPKRKLLKAGTPLPPSTELPSGGSKMTVTTEQWPKGSYDDMFTKLSGKKP